MTKKIIDVPYSTDFIYVNYGALTSTGGLTSFSSARYIPNELEDAPTVAENVTVEKRVIELPADVIEGVQNAKYYWENVIGFVLNTSSIIFPEIHKSIGEPNASYDKVADILGSWYFGNIEFVPKKEPEFYVRVYIGGKEQSVVKWQNFDGENEISFDVFMRNEPTYKEAEADRLVSGLIALNARKVKVED